MTVRRAHHVTEADLGGFSNIPMSESDTFDIHADDNPSNEEALGEYAWWSLGEDDFEVQTSTPDEQALINIATLLTGIPNNLKSIPNLYAPENIDGFGLIEHPHIRPHDDHEPRSYMEIAHKVTRSDRQTIHRHDPDTWPTSIRVRYHKERVA